VKSLYTIERPDVRKAYKILKDMRKVSRTINHNRVDIVRIHVFMIVGGNKIMPRDPVCGVILDEKTAKFKISYDGEKYYFCSVKCKKRFKRNPNKFMK